MVYDLIKAYHRSVKTDLKASVELMDASQMCQMKRANMYQNIRNKRR